MKTIRIYEWREIGETDWERCYTPETFAYYEKSTEHDTRMIYS